MPSPDLLPKGRSFPAAVAPPLDDVLSRARRRRTRRAGVVGGVTLAVVAAVAVAVVPHGSSQSMDVVTPTVSDHSIAPSPSPSAHAPDVAVARRAPADTTAKTTRHVTGTQTTTATTQRVAGSAPSQTAPSAAPDQGTAVRRTVGPPHRTTAYHPTQPCTGSGPTAAQGWCSYYSGATAGSAGQTVTLATSMCRLPGQGAGTLVSRTGRQADFAVGKQAYPPVWRWSHGRSFTQSTTSIRLAAGTCVEWFVSWRVVDNTGKPLAPGTYYLDAAPRVHPASAPGSAYASKPGSFTVR